MSMNGNKSDSEKEADQFASYLLMPYDALLEYEHNKGKWDLEKVIDAEQFFQVSHQAMLHRLVYDNLLDNEVADKYKSITVSTVAAKLGYGKELYFPTDEKKQYFTTGEYIRKVEKMAEKGIATNVHYKPLPLLTAYKDLGFDIQNYPNAYHMFENEITLPLHTKLSDEDVEYIITSFKECL